MRIRTFISPRSLVRPGIALLLGLLLGFLGGLAMAWLLVVKFALGQDIGGRPLFLTAILLLVFSVQFITTGVLAETCGANPEER